MSFNVLKAVVSTGKIPFNRDGQVYIPLKSYMSAKTMQFTGNERPGDCIKISVLDLQNTWIALSFNYYRLSASDDINDGGLDPCRRGIGNRNLVKTAGCLTSKQDHARLLSIQSWPTNVNNLPLVGYLEVPALAWRSRRQLDDSTGMGLRSCSLGSWEIVFT